MTEEQKEKHREANRKYREANRAKIRAKGRKYYRDNKDKCAAANRKYRAANGDKVRDAAHRKYLAGSDRLRASRDRKRLRYIESNARRRSAKRGIAYTLPDGFVADLWARQGGRCHYTGRPMTHGPDGSPELVSLDREDNARGYEPENVVLCCWAVNRMKHAYTVAQFRFWCDAVASYRPQDTP